MVKEVKTDEFEREVLNSQVPVLVDLWAPWCAPCPMIAPVVEDLAKEYSGKLNVVKVNVDECPEIAVRYQVQAIPTLLIFKNGKPVETLVGFRTKEELKKKINEHL